MITVKAPTHAIKTTVSLPGSKSISNRLLILRAASGLPLHYKNLSESDDTVLLAKSLGKIHGKRSGTLDVHHAGTDFRFLTAYLAFREGDWLLTGSDSLRKRPVGALVEALKQLGADITYTEKEGYPPLRIKGKKPVGHKVTVDGSTSSQFVSALLLLTPSFPGGLEVEVTGKAVSLPYIGMTVSLLRQFGVSVTQKNSIIYIKGTISPTLRELVIESDWSAASYWYSIAALCPGSEIILEGLNRQSLQADSILPALFGQFGVDTAFADTHVVLTSSSKKPASFAYDFVSCPDIAQTLAVTCLGLGIKAELTGLSTLKIKETDRIAALKTELEKFGAVVEASGSSLSFIPPASLKNPSAVSTYADHRMAMSFAPLAVLHPVRIESPEIVNKSYPGFWDDLEEAGFTLD